MIYDSDYMIRLATLQALGGDATREYDSVYEIDLEILRLAQGGGGGGGAEIDDDHVSTGTTYSSSKITQLLAGVGFNVVVVETLPSEGEERTVYLVPKVDTEIQDIYDEYIYINDAWERIGNTAIDLSDKVSSDSVSNIWSGTQAEYDAITTKSPSTLYLIKE